MPQLLYDYVDVKLVEEISITTGAYSCSTEDYSSASDESTASSYSSDYLSVESAKATLDTLRRRRKAFLRRRSQELAAGADTEEDDDAPFHWEFSRPALKNKKPPLVKLPPRCCVRTGSSLLAEAGRVTSTEEGKLVPKVWNFPSQELRCDEADVLPIKGYSPTVVSAESVFNSVEGVLLNPSIKDAPKGNPSHPPKEKSLRLSDDNPMSPRQQKWHSVDKEIVNLLSTDTSDDFLDTHHLGPVVREPCRSLVESGIQRGDVIIRLNGTDVRSLEAKAVSGIIRGLAGERVCVTFLRKNMML